MLLSCTSLFTFYHLRGVCCNQWEDLKFCFTCISMSLSCVCMCLVCVVVRMYGQNTQKKKTIGFVQVLVAVVKVCFWRILVAVAKICADFWLQLSRFICAEFCLWLQDLCKFWLWVLQGLCRFWIKQSEFFADFSCSYENFVLILVAIVRFVQNHICVQPKTDSMVVHIWSKEVA